MEVNEDDIRQVIKTYFTEHSFVKQQMDSCNKFYEENMQKTIDNLREIVITSFDNQIVEKREQFMPDFAIRSAIVTQGFRHAIASGNWDDKTSGVSQVLHRMTYVATFSRLRRLNSTFGYQGSQTKPRQVHSSQWERICCAKTPEGQACGLVKNLALMANVTVGSREDQISELLKESADVFDFLLRKSGRKEHKYETTGKARDKYKVLLDECLLGFHSDGKQLVSKLRQLKRKAAITSDFGVVMDFSNMEVRICTDYGRCSCPLLVENQSILMKKDLQELEQDDLDGKWDKLLRKGYLEYILMLMKRKLQ